MLWNETGDNTVWHLSSSHLSWDVIFTKKTNLVPF